MPEQLIGGVVSIAAAVIGLAALAVLVSRNANTSGVIKAASAGYSQILATAISPVTGGGISGGSLNGITSLGNF